MIKHLITQKNYSPNKLTKEILSSDLNIDVFSSLTAKTYEKQKKRLKVFEEPKETTSILRWKKTLLILQYILE